MAQKLDSGAIVEVDKGELRAGDETTPQNRSFPLTRRNFGPVGHVITNTCKKRIQSERCLRQALRLRGAACQAAAPAFLRA